jgi:hypothetical protein
MKKLVAFLLTSAVCLWAADFWISKPYTDWNEKEMQKIMSESPWAHRVDVEMSFGINSKAVSDSKGGRGSRGGGGGILSADGTSSATSGADLSGGGRGGPAGAGGGEDGIVAQTIPVMLVWQSSLPVKQAIVRGKYGSEAATSQEAKAFLEREEQFYVLTAAGLPATVMSAAEGDRKAALLQLSSLNVKGKEPIRAAEVQFNQRQRLADAVFFFPKTKPLTVEDKEVEFSTKFDKMAVKYRFKLKDMVFHGKLEL